MLGLPRLRSTPYDMSASKPAEWASSTTAFGQRERHQDGVDEQAAGGSVRMAASAPRAVTASRPCHALDVRVSRRGAPRWPRWQQRLEFRPLAVRGPGLFSTSWGHWFEPSRVHHRSPCKCRGFVVSGENESPARVRPVGEPLPPGPRPPTGNTRCENSAEPRRNDSTLHPRHVPSIARPLRCPRSPPLSSLDRLNRCNGAGSTALGTPVSRWPGHWFEPSSARLRKPAANGGFRICHQSLGSAEPEPDDTDQVDEDEETDDDGEQGGRGGPGEPRNVGG